MSEKAASNPLQADNQETSCEHCGAFVLKSSNKCPRCGKFPSKLHKCPACGSIAPLKDANCWKCGRMFEPDSDYL